MEVKRNLIGKNYNFVNSLLLVKSTVIKVLLRRVNFETFEEVFDERFIPDLSSASNI